MRLYVVILLAYPPSFSRVPFPRNTGTSFAVPAERSGRLDIAAAAVE